MQQKIWGTPIWIFFHSLANDISERQFLNLKNKIIDLFKDTCALLPCIVCREHAIHALSLAYLKSINTKNDFINFLHQFHNLVNIKRGVSPINKEELNNIYKNINFKNTVNNFLNVFYMNIGSKDLSYGLKKNMFLDENIEFIKFLKNSISKN